MNNWTGIGNLTRDVDLRYTESGTAVASMTVAIGRGKDRDGKDLGTDFPQVTIWGKQAENCSNFLSKGSKVAVSGRVTTGSYKDKDGKTVYTTGITADRVEFLSSKQNDSASGFKPEDESQVPEGFSSLDDDMDSIPF